jgi:hypothetical protein
VKVDYTLLFSHCVNVSYSSSNEIILSNSSLKTDIELQSDNAMFGKLNSHSYSKFLRCVDLTHLYELPILSSFTPSINFQNICSTSKNSNYGCLARFGKPIHSMILSR